MRPIQYWMWHSEPRSLSPSAERARLLEILQVCFVVGTVLRDARQLQGGLDLCARGVLRRRQRVRQIERFLEARRAPRSGRSARPRPRPRAWRRGTPWPAARLAEVMGEQLGLGRRRSRETGSSRVSPMRLWYLQALAAQQAVVGGVLDQRVLELVDRFRRRAAAIDQLGVDQLVESMARARPRPAARPPRAGRG